MKMCATLCARLENWVSTAQIVRELVAHMIGRTNAQPHSVQPPDQEGQAPDPKRQAQTARGQSEREAQDALQYAHGHSQEARGA
jgi:hypothetical protein